MEEEGGGDIVYFVNVFVFYLVYGIFVFGGGDGMVVFWDVEVKRRMR